MEYSIWHQIVTIWSTPPGAFLVSYGVLQDQLHLTIYIAIWSTPYGHFLMPYGVLHVVTISCRMECFILLPSMSIVEEMERAPQDLFSMLYGVLHMALNYYHMEYSMWSLFPAIWSASYHYHPCQLWKKCEELHKTCFQCSMEYSIWP